MPILTSEPLYGPKAKLVGDMVLALLKKARDLLQLALEKQDNAIEEYASNYALACTKIEIEWCRLRYVRQLSDTINKIEMAQIRSNITEAIRHLQVAGKFMKNAGKFARTTNIAFAYFVLFEAMKRTEFGASELEAILIQAASYNTCSEIRHFLASHLLECRFFAYKRNDAWDSALYSLTSYGENILRNLYQQLDRDSDGFLNYDDVCGLVILPVEDFYKMTRACETSSEGSLNFAGFVQFVHLYLRYDRHCIFDAFENLQKSVVKHIYESLDSGRRRNFLSVFPGRHDAEGQIMEKKNDVNKALAPSEEIIFKKPALLEKTWATRLL